MDTHSAIKTMAFALAILALPMSASAADAISRQSGTLRAGPASDYPSVGHVRYHEGLVLHGCLSSYAWCDVTAGNERGWYPGSRIDFLQDGRRARISVYGPRLGLSILSFGLREYWGTHYNGRSWVNEPRWQTQGGAGPQGMQQPGGSAPSQQGMQPGGSAPSQQTTKPTTSRHSQQTTKPSTSGRSQQTTKPSSSGRSQQTTKPSSSGHGNPNKAPAKSQDNKPHRGGDH